MRSTVGTLLKHSGALGGPRLHKQLHRRALLTEYSSSLRRRRRPRRRRGAAAADAAPGRGPFPP
eukprot:5945472-Heterocapsa_arctica.AAC.1